MLSVVIVYAGRAVELVGAVSLIKPLRFLGIRTRGQFPEVHRTHVAAPRDEVYKGDQGCPGEIALFQTLTWLRRLGRPSPENILNAPERRPILDTAMRSGFWPLADDPGREIVIGLVMGPPEDAANGGCWVSTETRIYATDSAARRRFGAYWSVVAPGSALIRRMWLRAIKARAEQKLIRERIANPPQVDNLPHKPAFWAVVNYNSIKTRLREDKEHHL
jgi:hypothetical protein